jgi:hypothetical protein
MRSARDVSVSAAGSSNTSSVAPFTGGLTVTLLAKLRLTARRLLTAVRISVFAVSGRPLLHHFTGARKSRCAGMRLR